MKLNTGKFTIERLVELKENNNIPYQWNNGRIIMAYEIGRVRLALVNVNPIEEDRFNLETPEGIKDLNNFLKENPEMEAGYKLEILLPLSYASVNEVGNKIFGEENLKYTQYLTDTLFGEHTPKFNTIVKSDYISDNFELTIDSFMRLQETHPELFSAITYKYKKFYETRPTDRESYVEYTIADDKTDSIFYNEGYIVAEREVNHAKIVLQVVNSNSTNRATFTNNISTYDLHGIEEIREYVKNDKGVFDLFNESDYLDVDAPAYEIKFLLPYGVDKNGDTQYIQDELHPAFDKSKLFDFSELDIPDITSFRFVATKDFDDVIETIKEYYNGFLFQNMITTC